MNSTELNGEMFADMIRGGAANLYSNREIVNDLNVFPIPDGDTGDNMYMTMDSGASAVGESGNTLGEVSSQIASGMLLGARGNSGVILSRFFAGLAAGLENLPNADIQTVSDAFDNGVKEAYSSVAQPVEGTILTVLKDATCFARERITPDSTLQSFFDDFLKELKESLERTPDMLDVLKKAGVVDSGGAGFVYIAEGMKNVLDGNSVPETDGRPVQGASKKVDVSTFTSDSILKFGYCTEFLLRLQNRKCDIASFDIGRFTDELNAIGESVVAFRDDTIVKVHVHTMTPGQILDFGQKYGEFLTLKIENMMLQHNETNIQNNYTPGSRKPHKEYGVVVVAAGEGIKEMFSSLGADVVVDGGQSMNPSAADFIDAFEQVNADTILVYPNNSNIILTANQAAELYDKAKIEVVKSRTIGEGYASLSMLDVSSGDTAAILAEAEDIISEVVTGIVSRANKDADGEINVHSGDYIGFADDRILTDENNRNEALLKLADSLDAGSRDVVLLISGKDTSGEESAEAIKALQQKYRRTEFIEISGGQPIYDYILILE